MVSVSVFQILMDDISIDKLLNHFIMETESAS